VLSTYVPCNAGEGCGGASPPQIPVVFAGSPTSTSAPASAGDRLQRLTMEPNSGTQRSEPEQWAEQRGANSDERRATSEEVLGVQRQRAFIGRNSVHMPQDFQLLSARAHAARSQELAAALNSFHTPPPRSEKSGSSSGSASVHARASWSTVDVPP
jgi:hypothetical protein